MTSRRPAAVALLPAQPGVYRFRDAHGAVLYIGRAVHLRRRVASYWGDLGGRGHLSRMIPRIARIEALECESEHESAWTERNLLEQWLPPWNRSRGGEESPLHIRLDASCGAPRVDAVHLAAPGPGLRYFGPYLGGRKVRLAVTALHRIFPLAYAGADLTAAERDMARLRGVTPGARTQLIDAITAVLRREPAAVATARTELTIRREAAAAELQYELAGRLTDELSALNWVVAPQRVIVADGGNATPSGWSCGVFVRFTVRNGRLCEWDQRPCERAGSGVSAGRAWGSFVRTNVALAAALAERPVLDDRSAPSVTDEVGQ